MGHMQEISDQENEDKLAYYIPHQAVTRQDSVTTKLRVVFDASMKTNSGLSLNDVQHIEPKLQTDIMDILLRFRTYRYAMSADISKMYRMVWIDNQHRPLRRIFWRSKTTEPVKCYELKTLTYRTASGPYLAMRCLRQIAEEARSKHPAVSKAIEQCFYVDDFLCGARTSEELTYLQREVSAALSTAGFHLRKWRCNVSNLTTSFMINQELEQGVLHSEGFHKVLGVSWDSDKDELFCGSMMNGANACTKRSVLAELSKIFDPLGLLSPFTIKGKLLLQELWQQSKSWDESLPQHLSRKWYEFKEDFRMSSEIRISRLAMIATSDSAELHGFSDASEKAYGACIYLKSSDRLGKITCRLLCAKGKVAPLKTVSLPRLELCAALLLTRLAERVRRVLGPLITDTTYWTDSMVTLSWIHGSPTRWKTYVANRVAEIQEKSKPEQWFYVSTKENPADLITRSTSIRNLKNRTQWWEGPQWLTNSTDPRFPCPRLSDIPEQWVITLAAPGSQLDKFIDRYSTLERAVRIAARCLRFWSNCRSRKENRQHSELHAKELQEALRHLIQCAQQQAFAKEYGVLHKGHILPKGSPLRTLHPFIDREGLIRVKGRLSNCAMEYQAKHPIILPKRDRLTTLLITQVHNDQLHCGPNTLLATLRQRYWPIDGRNQIKKVIRQCMICTRARPRTAQYLMGQLPEARVTRNFPFFNVGVDYAGPILMKDRKTRNPKTVKVYICLSVCLATKAIHLELVVGQTTEAFLACLKRFISRRGRPSTIFSDNAKNFKGANSALSTLINVLHRDANSIHKTLASENIKWKFIPARSPTFGGIWEADIKSMKYNLIRCLKNDIFTYEELATILCQIEGVLNSRPLTPLSSNPDDPTPLTPGHFLIGRSVNQLPEDSDIISVPENTLGLYQRMSKIIQTFWKRWTKEFLSQLQARQQWNKAHPTDQKLLQPGQVVLLKDDSPPFQWPMAVITDVHPGSDGVIRVVTLNCRGSQLTRGVREICPLPGLTKQRSQV